MINKEMKCKACGYVEGRPIATYNENGELVMVEGTFWLINGNFNIEAEDQSIERVDLFACPKCNTVLMKRWIKNS